MTAEIRQSERRKSPALMSAAYRTDRKGGIYHDRYKKFSRLEL